MTYDVRALCADMVLTSAIEDQVLITGLDANTVRSNIIHSPAYQALYDFDTGLWQEGPDYFIWFYTQCNGNGHTVNDVAK